MRYSQIKCTTNTKITFNFWAQCVLYNMRDISNLYATTVHEKMQ